jgi:hypothetical protein
VTCPHWFRFTLDPYLLDLFEFARERIRVLRLLALLSDAARRTAAEGGQLSLTAANWRAAASITDAALNPLTRRNLPLPRFATEVGRRRHDTQRSATRRNERLRKMTICGVKR